MKKKRCKMAMKLSVKDEQMDQPTDEVLLREAHKRLFIMNDIKTDD